MESQPNQSAREVALELWVSTQIARPRDVKEYAEIVSTDHDFIAEVMRQYSELQSGKRKFDSDVSQIWRDDKYS